MAKQITTPIPEHCPKCGDKMKRSQRVNQKGTGLEPAVFKSACGWQHKEGEKEGYWTR